MTEVLNIAYEMAQDLFKAGAMDESTMKNIKSYMAESRSDLSKVDATTDEELEKSPNKKPIGP